MSPFGPAVLQVREYPALPGVRDILYRRGFPEVLISLEVPVFRQALVRRQVHVPPFLRVRPLVPVVP